MSEEQIKQYADSVAGKIPSDEREPWMKSPKCLLPRFDESSYVTGIELFVDGGMTQI